MAWLRKAEFSDIPTSSRALSTVTGWAGHTALEEAGGTSASEPDVLETPETLGVCMAWGKLSAV